MSSLPDLLQPLMFRCVMETHEVKAKDCIVFRLPDEIIANIVRHLIDSRVDLGSLALVNQDFRQLARACQFRVITFDGSNRCHNGILALLNSEAFERMQNRSYHGQTQRPSVSACIRKVVVNNYGGLRELKGARESDDHRELRGRVSARNREYRDPNIHSIIPSLPNLRTLDLSSVTLSQSLFNSLVGSTVDTVMLFNTRITAVCPRMRAGVSWPITSLTLKPSAAANHPGNLSLYWESILRLCSPTLTRLTISHYCFRCHAREHTSQEPLSFNLRFPQLSYLDIKWAIPIDMAALQSLLLTSRHLSYLSIDCTTEPAMELLNRSHTFDALRTLVVNFEPASTFLSRATQMNVDFIKNNHEITSFAFTDIPTKELSEQILSELCFLPRLKRLMVAWGLMWAQDPSLEASWMKLNASLEELYLIIGTDGPLLSSGDHDEIRRILSPRFRGLKRLGLSCWKNYFLPHPRPVEWTVKATLGEAVSYGTSFPSLEVLRLEDLTIDIARDGGVRARRSTEQFDFPFLGDFDIPTWEDHS